MGPKNWNLNFDQWMAIAGSLIIVTVSAITFLYLNFETKESFNQYRENETRLEERLEDHLERIENKLDSFLFEEVDLAPKKKDIPLELKKL